MFNCRILDPARKLMESEQMSSNLPDIRLLLDVVNKQMSYHLPDIRLIFDGVGR